MKKILLITALFGFVCLPLHAEPQLYETLWTNILQENVIEGKRKSIKSHLVRYKNVAQSQTFSSLIRHISMFDPSTLKDRKEQLAFWINMYNIAVVHTLAQHYPIQSIKDTGTLINPIWDRPLINVGSNYYSLSEIENQILKKLHEPRLYYALCNGTLSSADLRREAYTDEKLDAQLTDQMTKFLANRTKGIRVHKGTKEVRVSSLLKWHQDFILNSAPKHAYIQPHVERRIDDFRVSYLNYNWGVNGTRR
jgi:hypothetical protein